MPENCENCPVSARVDSLEREFDRYRDSSSKTHGEMFERLGKLERDQSGFQEWKKSVDAKLDTIVEWVEGEKNKPNKLMDKLKENGIWMVLAALIGVVLARWGL